MGGKLTQDTVGDKNTRMSNVSLDESMTSAKQASVAKGAAQGQQPSTLLYYPEK